MAPIRTPIRASILTVSDRSFSGVRADISGSAIVELLKTEGFLLSNTAIVPDEKGEIVRQLLQWVDENQTDLIFTTGGTGFAPRDVTPEATKSIVERETPGISEYIRLKSTEITPHASLSRAISGICRNCLIINLPGSPKAACESIKFILPVLPHAIELLNDDPGSERNH